MTRFVQGDAAQRVEPVLAREAIDRLRRFRLMRGPEGCSPAWLAYERRARDDAAVVLRRIAARRDRGAAG